MGNFLPCFSFRFDPEQDIEMAATQEQFTQLKAQAHREGKPLIIVDERDSAIGIESTDGTYDVMVKELLEVVGKNQLPLLKLPHQRPVKLIFRKPD